MKQTPIEDEKNTDIIAGKFNVNEIIDLIEGTAKEIESIKDKTMFMVVGDTGTGKSTGIRYLLGERFEKNSSNGAINPKNTQSSRLPKKLPTVGKNVESETFYPSAYFRQNDHNYPFIYGDFPGFLETRTPEQKVCVSINAELAVKLSNKVEGVVVFIAASAFLEERGNTLRKVVETLAQLIRTDDYVSSPFLFVITQADKIPKFDKRLIANKAEAIREALSNTLNKKLEELEKPGNKQNTDLTTYIELMIHSIKIFDLMAKIENNIILDILDTGESRKIVHQKLGTMKNKSEIKKDSFNFNTFSEDRREFSKIIYECVKSGNLIFQKIESLNKQILETQNEEKTITARTKALSEQLNQLNGQGSTENTKKAVSEMHKKINENKVKINSLDEKIDLLKQEEASLKQEYKVLTESTESTFYRKETVNEKNSAIGRTTRHFKYNEPNVPLTEVKKSFENDGIKTNDTLINEALDVAKDILTELLPVEKVRKFINVAGKLLKIAKISADFSGFANEVKKLDKGHYEVTYYSKVGSEGISSVEFYAQKKDLPKSKERAQIIKNRLEGVNAKGKDGTIYSIESITNEIQKLKDQKNGFIKENERTQDSIVALQRNDAVLNAQQKTEIQKDLENLDKRKDFLKQQFSELGLTLKTVYKDLDNKEGLFKTIQTIIEFIDDFKEFSQFPQDYEKIKSTYQKQPGIFHNKTSSKFTLFKEHEQNNFLLYPQSESKQGLRSRL